MDVCVCVSDLTNLGTHSSSFYHFAFSHHYTLINRIIRCHDLAQTSTLKLKKFQLACLPWLVLLRANFHLFTPSCIFPLTLYANAPLLRFPLCSSALINLRKLPCFFFSPHRISSHLIYIKMKDTKNKPTIKRDLYVSLVSLCPLACFILIKSTVLQPFVTVLQLYCTNKLPNVLLSMSLLQVYEHFITWISSVWFGFWTWSTVEHDISGRAVWIHTSPSLPPTGSDSCCSDFRFTPF